MNPEELNKVAPLHVTTRHKIQIRMSDIRGKGDEPCYCVYHPGEGVFLGMDNAQSWNPQWHDTVKDCEEVIADYLSQPTNQ